jgi:hypothetical protein
MPAADSDLDLFEIDTFQQALIFVKVEVAPNFPISIPDGQGSEETRATVLIEEISSGLIREDNSFICIDNGNIVYLKMLTPVKFRINVGDIVKPAQVMQKEELPSWLMRRFDFDRDINFNYPEGYYQVVEIEDDEEEIVLVSLLTGARRRASIHSWIKIGYAGVLEIEEN